MPVTKDGTAYDFTGPEQAPVVVLIHGLGLTRSSTWGTIATGLAERYRVLTYDLLGHGDTAVPRGPVSLTALSAQLIALLDTLDISQAALVGFSLGGMINRRCAMDHPDRVSALVILNSPHDRGADQQRIVEDRARGTASGGPEAGINVTLARWFTEGFRRHHSDRVADIRETVLKNDHANYAAHRQVLASGVTELIAPSPPITSPMLVMTSENDSGSTPAMSHAIVAETPGAEICIVPHLQHLGLIEQPALFSEPVGDFLNRVLT
ncbi:alpha/beta hydrolase [Aestuariivita sp.]|jgi:pimeloyl-ACP methyl ester carboxylesterase|uniref:alpha/beta fold hydrolase n=1 Tax=Aestuariivita sp. TaxID=1872407 RepID=UPI00216E2A20|nr:alpha/beta hydrolase [Aestuariivita sp.]MCE8007006.1 alpha/beta fold hydrolase [Aestuariivita sp.]